MSEENVEIIRRAYDAWAQGDIQAIVDLCHPGIVIVQPPQVPDAKSYEGHEGVFATFEDWPKQWDEFEARLGEIIDVDERHVISECKQSVAARGMEMEIQAYFLHTMEAGKHLRIDMFLSRQEALDAAR